MLVNKRLHRRKVKLEVEEQRSKEVVGRQELRQVKCCFKRPQSC